MRCWITKVMDPMRCQTIRERANNCGEAHYPITKAGPYNKGPPFNSTLLAINGSASSLLYCIKNSGQSATPILVVYKLMDKLLDGYDFFQMQIRHECNTGYK